MSLSGIKFCNSAFYYYVLQRCNAHLNGWLKKAQENRFFANITYDSFYLLLQSHILITFYSIHVILYLLHRSPDWLRPAALGPRLLPSGEAWLPNPNHLLHSSSLPQTHPPLPPCPLSPTKVKASLGHQCPCSHTGGSCSGSRGSGETQQDLARPWLFSSLAGAVLGLPSIWLLGAGRWHNPEAHGRFAQWETGGR